MFQTTFWMFAKLFGAFIKKAGTFVPAKKRNLEMYRFTTAFL